MKRNAQQAALPAAANARRYVKEWLLEQARAIVDPNRAVLEIDEQPPRAVASMRDPDRAKEVSGNFLENEFLEDAGLLGGQCLTEAELPRSNVRNRPE